MSAHFAFITNQMVNGRSFEQLLAVLGRSASGGPAFADLCNLLALIAQDDSARRSSTIATEVRTAISTFIEAVASIEDEPVRRLVSEAELIRAELADSGLVREQTVDAARNILRGLGL